MANDVIKCAHCNKCFFDNNGDKCPHCGKSIRISAETADMFGKIFGSEMPFGDAFGDFLKK